MSPRFRSFDDACRFWSARRPTAVATLDSSDLVSFQTLDEWASQIAGRLASLGIARGARIGLLTGRTVDVVVGFVAISRAGGTIVPLEPLLPDSRLRSILADAEIECLLISDEQKDRAVFGHSCRTVRLGSERTRHPLLSRTTTHPNGLAYVMYTSGSTGTPKGVAVTEGALAAFADACVRRFGEDGPINTLAVSSIGFDMTCLDVGVALWTGGACAILPTDPMELPAECVRVLRRLTGLTILQTTPTMWRWLLRKSDLQWGRVIAISGGEPLDDGVKALLVERCHSAWNFYGPTEGTVYCSAQRLSKEPVSLGTALDGYEVLVAAEDLRPAAKGAAGEILIGGVGLADRYLNDPELTTERFVQVRNPSGGVSRKYRTGDLGRVLPNGELVYVGRLDDQIQVAGVRVEPGEIEHALRQCRGVGAAAAIGVPSPTGGFRLHGFVTPVQDGALIDPGAVRAELAGLLPTTNLPSRLHVLDRLPVTPRGKIDQAALRALGAGDIVSHTPSQGRARRYPRTDREHQEEFHRFLYRNVLDADVAVDMDEVRFGGTSHTGHLTSYACDLLSDEILTESAGASVARLLELGSGFGAATRHITTRLAAAGVTVRQAIGVDFSWEHCRVMRTLGAETEPRPVVLCADVGALPLHSRSVNIAFSVGTIAHLRDFRAVVSEAARVLHEGGVLYLLDEVGLRAEGATLSAEFTRWHPPHVFHNATLAERTNDLRLAGFTHISTRDVSRWARSVARQRLLALRLAVPRLNATLGTEQATQIVESVKATKGEYDRGNLVPYVLRASLHARDRTP